MKMQPCSALALRKGLLSTEQWGFDPCASLDKGLSIQAERGVDMSGCVPGLPAPCA